VDGDYTPENTRWIPAHSGNRRSYRGSYIE
jgi:hypothetical protein